ncbi:MAG: DUF5659 domain-containing protein [Acidobacteria bacterium]|nr:DUF5659 domain-containing protein [Acidobacteriota bacterium]
MPFRTGDLAVGAFLRARGMPLTDVEWEGERGVLVFENEDECRSLTREFIRGAQVAANEYAKALSELKIALFSTRRR